MGIEKLAGRLPRKKVDYLKVRRTKGAAMVVRIDAAGALWLCAYRSKETYAFGDFFAAWARWQRLLQQWKMVDFKGELVFDGKDSPHKKPERERRDAKQQAARERIAAAKEEGKDPLAADIRDLIRNEPLYIAGGIKIARALGFKCRVMPFEADAYVGGVDCGGDVLSVSADSDMAMYNTATWLQPTDWTTGHAHMVDFAEFSSEDEERLPLVAAHAKHGKPAIVHAAAVAGCDMVQEDKTKGISWEKVLPALKAVEPLLTPSKVTKYLQGNYPGLTKNMEPGAAKEYWEGVTTAIQAAVTGVAEATYYQADGAICLASGRVKTAASDTSRKHMNGELNPRTGEPFSATDQAELDGLDPSELSMPSQVPESQLAAARELPDAPTTAQAQQFIVSFGGSTSQSGKALTAAEAKEKALEYREFSKEVPMLRVDRSRQGGLWLNAGVTSKTENKGTIKELLLGKEIDKVKHMNLRSFLQEVYGLYESGSFITDYDEIVSSSPELSGHVLRNFLAPLGSQSDSTKAINQARKRASEPTELLYHAIARAPGGERAFISSKQRASMKSDAAAKSGDHGEAPERKPYMTITELCFDATDAEEDGHDLGRVYAVGRAWCTCVDGSVECGHKGASIETQRLHWNEGRPEPKPTHFDRKQWGKHRKRKKRKASRLVALDEVPMGVQSSGATQHRQVRDPDAKADYEVCDMAVVRKHCNPARALRLCELIREHNNKTLGSGDCGESDMESDAGS